jgi:hypothetical protein
MADSPLGLSTVTQEAKAHGPCWEELIAARNRYGNIKTRAGGIHRTTKGDDRKDEGPNTEFTVWEGAIQIFDKKSV